MEALKDSFQRGDDLLDNAKLAPALVNNSLVKEVNLIVI